MRCVSVLIMAFGGGGVKQTILSPTTGGGSGSGGGAATAEPVGALLASVSERLALMPLVAEAKRGSGRALSDPAREQRVIEAALASVDAAAREAAVRAPHSGAVRAIFRSQIEAAKLIQQRVLASPPAPDAPRADLQREIRPALIRIGDRIARLLVAIANPRESAKEN